MADTGTGDLPKRLRSIAGGFTNRAWKQRKDINEAADALEAAERVIAPFAAVDAKISHAHLGGHFTGNDEAFVPIKHIRAASDWLARHATGQRKGEHLGPQVRPFSETQSAFSVVNDEFFGQRKRGDE